MPRMTEWPDQYLVDRHNREIAPLLITIQLQQFDMEGASAIATVMLVVSFAMLLVINGIQAWSRRMG